jgi:adenylate cyclase
MPRLLRSPVLAALGASVAVFIAVFALRWAGALEGLELAAYDWHIRLRAPAPPKKAPVVLVTITESDIQRLGTWPVPDGMLAEVLETAAGAGARAIGLDIYRDVPVPPGHERLNAVLVNHRAIIAPMMLPQGGRPGVAPPAALKGSEQVGFTDVVVDPGGTVRRGLLLMDDGRNVFFSFPFRLALVYLRAHGIAPQGDPDHPAYLKLGRATIRPFEPNDGSYVRADAGGYQFLLDYRERPQAFVTITLGQFLAGEFDRAALADKVVLVGVAADSVKDSFYTPYSAVFGERQPMYGVELYGHMVSQLVRAALDGAAPIAVLSDPYEALWILLWSLLGGALALVLRSAWRFALAIVAGVALLALGVHALFLYGWWIPVVPPAIGWVAAASVVAAHVSSREKQERAQLMGLFSSFMSAELAEFLWQEREQFAAGGRLRPQRLDATIFFADVMNFTTVSESLEPQPLMDWFYAFMETTTPLVSDHHGVILRFLGDSIMAAFGPPIPRASEAEIRQDAVNAVNCALATQERLIALNRRLEERGLPLISMRIGILSGRVVGGSIGTAKRFEYNVHGDTVNTASRLESFDKESFDPDYFRAPCRILIGEPTLRLIGEGFETEFVGEFRLKGKTRTIRIYRVYGRKVPAPLTTQAAASSPASAPVSPELRAGR